MQNIENSAPRRIGPILAALLGCLGIGLLALLCLIVFGGLAYLRGYSLPPIFSSATPAPTNTPLPTLTAVPTQTFTPSPTFTATQTPTASPTATIIFHTPTFIPTRTRTPTATRTRTPVATQTPITKILNDAQYNFNFNAWIGLANNHALGKGMRCSSKKDELLTFDTSRGASRLSLFFYKGPNQGKARIIVDGAAVETLDLYKASPQYHFEWNYQFPNTKQAHQVKVVILREKRNASTGYQVCFDGFRVDNMFTDDTNYGIRYDAWSGNWNRKALGGGYRSSATADSSVTFTIRGSSFQWITNRGPNQGQADVYVDDKFIVTVDLYFPTHKWQQAILINKLGQGNHTVKIVVLGQHNSASGGNTIVFDGILVP